MSDPIRSFLERQPVMILDGGLATELEARGITLDAELWSAALLLEDPAAIRAVHRSYLDAGADCIVSATYQATRAGFEAKGLNRAEADRLLRRAVEIAVESRDEFWTGQSGGGDRLRPLVAAGVGPYGAFLADGSEYTGDYDLDEQGLIDFHRERWRLLAAAGADLLACETIPSMAEARALVRLLETTPDVTCWVSFSCRDGERISDGSDFAAAVGEIQAARGVVAIGLNCTAPAFVPALLERAAAETDKPMIVYPNSGERWDAVDRAWLARGQEIELGEAAPEWVRLGARLVGGCCRTTPADIAGLRRSLMGSSGRNLGL